MDIATADRAAITAAGDHTQVDWTKVSETINHPETLIGSAGQKVRVLDDARRTMDAALQDFRITGFDAADSNGNGFLDKAEVSAIKNLPAPVVHHLELYGDKIQSQSNDEWGFENDGITKKDLTEGATVVGNNLRSALGLGMVIAFNKNDLASVESLVRESTSQFGRGESAAVARTFDYYLPGDPNCSYLKMGFEQASDGNAPKVSFWLGRLKLEISTDPNVPTRAFSRQADKTYQPYEIKSAFDAMTRESNTTRREDSSTTPYRIGGQTVFL